MPLNTIKDVSGAFDTELKLEDFPLQKEILGHQISLALNSSQYVKSVQLGDISYRKANGRFKRSDFNSKDQSNQDDFNFIDFTAQCNLISNLMSDDVKSKITESCAQFLNRTVSLEIGGVIFISKRQQRIVEKHVNISNEIFEPPTVEEFERIMKDDNKSYCKDFYKWTPWYSLDDATNGNDIEILAEHVNNYK